jgi:hypothetical protein
MAVQMVATKFNVRFSARERAIAAVTAGMVDASNSEVARYCILRLAGCNHDKAKELALSREEIDFSADDKVMTLHIPTEWFESAQEKKPELSPSTLLRYSMTRLAAESEEEALQLANRKIGRPKGSRNQVRN